MRLLFSEYADTIFEALVSVLVYTFVVYSFLTSLINTNSTYIEKVISPIDIYVENNPVSIEKFEVKDCLIDVSDDYSYLDYVEAFNSRGEDIKMYVTVLNLPDLKKEGEYELTYTVRYNGESKAINAKLIIVDKQKELKEDEIDV